MEIVCGSLAGALLLTIALWVLIFRRYGSNIGMVAAPIIALVSIVIAVVYGSLANDDPIST